MQNQSIQRYIVWGALAAVSYLILLQWDTDYKKTIDVQNGTTITQVQENEKKESAEKNLEDIPVLEDKKNESQTTVKKTTEKSLINISSETIKLTIDLYGGDIVYAALPEHAVDIDHPEQAFTLLEEDAKRTYIAQSGLIRTNGNENNQKGRPLFKSEKKDYHLDKQQSELSVPIKYIDDEGNEITKVFTISKGSYLVDVKYIIKNNEEEQWKGNLFAQLKRDNSKDPLASNSKFGMKPFLGIAYWSKESKYNKIKINKIKEEPVKETNKAGWLAFVQHYFLSAWVAPINTTNTYSTRINSKGENIFGFITDAITVKPKSSETIDFKFYAGPKDQNKLRKISSGLELTVDYGWLWMVSQTIFWLLLKIQHYVVNWGWSIVILTCTIKLLFFPLNQYAFKSMANMRKLQPKMQRLKELYGDDRQKLSQATMEMYRKEKINPLGSCLPMLIQMPVFMGLYWMLSESVELRHAHFIFWIKDLSIKDPYFVLPGLMAISMFVQQRLSPMVFQDPTQEKIMKLMPFMFAVFFLFFPAGLVLYWLVNNMLTILQQWVINRQIEAKE